MSDVMSFIGCIFLADVDAAGAITSKFKEAGEAYPLSLELTEEIVKIMGRTCTTNGKVIGTKTKPSDAGGSLVLHEYKADNVAGALHGVVTTLAVSSSTLTSQAVILGKFDEYTEIGTEDLSSVVVKDATDTTTYVLGTDYKIDTVLGLLSPLSGGAIAEDATVHVSAAGGGNTDQRISIGAGATVKKAIKGHLIDEFSGKDIKVFLRMVTMVSTKEVVLASDDGTEHETIEFDLVPEVPAGQSDYGTLDGLPL